MRTVAEGGSELLLGQKVSCFMWVILPELSLITKITLWSEGVQHTMHSIADPKSTTRRLVGKCQLTVQI